LDSIKKATKPLTYNKNFPQNQFAIFHQFNTPFIYRKNEFNG
jgi:hypothetical protein